MRVHLMFKVPKWGPTRLRGFRNPPGGHVVPLGTCDGALSDRVRHDASEEDDVSPASVADLERGTEGAAVGKGKCERSGRSVRAAARGGAG